MTLVNPAAGSPDTAVRWKGRQVRVEAKPTREAHPDGETGAGRPPEIDVDPAAQKVLAAKPSSHGG